MISHREQAARIGNGRSTYFEVKAGRGGKAPSDGPALPLGMAALGPRGRLAAAHCAADRTPG